MKSRCLNPRVKSYPAYGGRGITVCERWRDSYEAFLADVGRRPSQRHSLDRLDNNRGYEPENVAWRTQTEQGSNRRSNRLMTFDGITRTLRQWAIAHGIKEATLTNRLDRGWTIERALAAPVARRPTAEGV